MKRGNFGNSFTLWNPNIHTQKKIANTKGKKSEILQPVELFNDMRLPAECLVQVTKYEHIRTAWNFLLNRIQLLLFLEFIHKEWVWKVFFQLNAQAKKGNTTSFLCIATANSRLIWWDFNTVNLFLQKVNWQKGRL